MADATKTLTDTLSNYLLGSSEPLPAVQPVDKGSKVVRVTMTVDFIVPNGHKRGRTAINGWTMEEVINDWFKNENHDLNNSHATRDAFRVGGSTRIKKIAVVRATYKVLKPCLIEIRL